MVLYLILILRDFFVETTLISMLKLRYKYISGDEVFNVSARHEQDFLTILMTEQNRFKAKLFVCHQEPKNDESTVSVELNGSLLFNNASDLIGIQIDGLVLRDLNKEKSWEFVDHQHIRTLVSSTLHYLYQQHFESGLVAQKCTVNYKQQSPSDDFFSHQRPVWEELGFVSSEVVDNIFTVHGMLGFGRCGNFPTIPYEHFVYGCALDFQYSMQSDVELFKNKIVSLPIIKLRLKYIHAEKQASVSQLRENKIKLYFTVVLVMSLAVVSGLSMASVIYSLFFGYIYHNYVTPMIPRFGSTKKHINEAENLKKNYAVNMNEVIPEIAEAELAGNGLIMRLLYKYEMLDCQSNPLAYLANQYFLSETELRDSFDLADSYIESSCSLAEKLGMVDIDKIISENITPTAKLVEQ
ncbi:hypothetical protein A1QO_04180 [Vibrio genomosp. F10 str. ZF-129]|uniref:Uncharacterized protein n=1 Tax=Vibrio genomosp. F10 str. ZF-129 TaxID=1187848 RepID=A0A1E5BIT5_9VIBR|nr:hypothetical protein A1QO_04180 [Vibrio genomosp. F10 str. ZF-129]